MYMSWQIALRQKQTPSYAKITKSLKPSEIKVWKSKWRTLYIDIRLSN